jgi:ATP-binding cassette, subfamily B, bacterial
MIKLLLRLYQPQEGEILINGVNLNDLEIDTYIKTPELLMQDYNSYPYLTAQENIQIGRADIPLNQEKVIKAAESADALAFINDFSSEI